MCTVSIISTPSGFRLISSRDEQRSRPDALPPRWRDLDSPDGSLRATWPTDPQSHGTWVAATSKGLALALLNYNLEPKPALPRHLTSRGLVIPALAVSTSAHAAADRLAALDLDAFAPFRLIAASPAEDRPFDLLEARWDRTTLTVVPHRVNAACFVSSGLGDSLVEDRLPLFSSFAPAGWTPEDQDRFHLHAWPDRPEASVLMCRRDARTVSITTIDISRDPAGAPQARMHYRPVDDLTACATFDRSQALLAARGTGS